MKQKYHDTKFINTALSKILKNKKEVTEKEAYEYILEDKYSLNDVTCRPDEFLALNITSSAVCVIKYINQKNNRNYFVYSDHFTVKYFI